MVPVAHSTGGGPVASSSSMMTAGAANGLAKNSSTAFLYDQSGAAFLYPDYMKNMLGVAAAQWVETAAAANSMAAS